MATIANQKGGYFKDLTILRTASNESNTTLKDDFLKKASNYTCQVPQFILNNATRLSLLDEVMFEIRVKGVHNDNVNNVISFDENWIESDFKFRPKPYLSWLELARKLERFFHKFGVVAELKGFPGFNGQQLFNDYHPYTDIENQALGIISFTDIPAVGPEDATQGRHILFTLSDDGSFNLTFDPWFSTYFYIVVGPQTQIKTGFPEYMFVVAQGNGLPIDHIAGINNLFQQVGLDQAPPQYIFTALASNVPNAKMVFPSVYSLESFDDRLTLDIIASLPLSTRVTCLNGQKPEHDYVLARFPIGDYQNNVSEVTVQQNRLQNKNLIKEALKIGLEDLCNGNQNSTLVYLLPGKIRHVNIRLMTRYLHEGKFKSIPTDMRDGTFVLKLLFTKKQT